MRTRLASCSAAGDDRTQGPLVLLRRVALVVLSRAAEVRGRRDLLRGHSCYESRLCCLGYAGECRGVAGVCARMDRNGYLDVGVIGRSGSQVSEVDEKEV